MANYVLVFKGGTIPETEEEQQRVMGDWGAWYGGLGAAVVDGGNPFGPSVTVARDGAVSDGAESNLTGYHHRHRRQPPGRGRDGQGLPHPGRWRGQHRDLRDLHHVVTAGAGTM